ncbi:MAG: ABC transporter ATP-binding protein, partial [Candidatus Gastranaerophilales bacterium]|nr:ABC transporter ATP-binding protein [Candidatus Gastranaerophilales bacterium]
MRLDDIKTTTAFDYKYLLKRIYPYIKPLFFRIFIAFVLVIPLGLLDGVTAFVLKPYIDVVVNGDTLTYFGYTLTRDILAAIIPPGVVIFAGFQGVLRYLNTYLTDWISYTIANSIKVDLYKKLIYLDSKFYDENSSGLVISRFFNDPELASRHLIHSLKNIITSVTSSIGLLFVLLYNSWELAIVGVVVLVCAFLPMTLLRKKIKQVSNKTAVVGGDITTSFNETYKGNKVLTGYNLQEDMYVRVKKLIRDTFNLQMSLTKRIGWLSPVMYIIASIGIAGVMLVGNKLIVAGRLTTGSFASFITSLLLLYKPVKSLGHDLTNIQSIFVAISRVFELFDFNTRIKDEGKKELNFVPEKIEFSNVSFSYNEEKEILHNIQLTINKGQTVAIVGNSGGGKSSIVNLLPRFYDVNQGAILFDGINIKDFSLQSLRDSISQVFQDNFIFSGTIKDNILIGKKDATKEEIEKVIKASHLDEFISTLPDGINTEIAENGASLSGGQKQRIAI